MRRAHWTSPAQSDLAALDDFFALISPDYALRVGRAALAAARFLAEVPAAGPAFDGVNRKWRVRTTDYLLIYRIVDDGVEILRVRHAREDWRPD